MRDWAEQGLGFLTRGFHAGETHLAINDASFNNVPHTLQVSSTSFVSGGTIPLRHAGAGLGENISPSLSWQSLPRNVIDLALIVEDPDAPLPRPFVHVLAWGLKLAFSLPESALSSTLTQGSVESRSTRSGEIVMGRNGFGRPIYEGPRALPHHGPHRYVFQLFALARPVLLEPGASRKELLNAMRGTVLACGRLDGLFEREIRVG